MSKAAHNHKYSRKKPFKILNSTRCKTVTDVNDSATAVDVARAA